MTGTATLPVALPVAAVSSQNRMKLEEIKINKDGGRHFLSSGFLEKWRTHPPIDGQNKQSSLSELINNNLLLEVTSQHGPY